MTETPNKGAKGDSAKAPGAAGAGREERLAAALRENLRRRKAQARGRAAPEAEREAGTHTEKRDSGGPES